MYIMYIMYKRTNALHVQDGSDLSFCQEMFDRRNVLWYGGSAAVLDTGVYAAIYAHVHGWVGGSVGDWVCMDTIPSHEMGV